MVAALNVSFEIFRIRIRLLGLVHQVAFTTQSVHNRNVKVKYIPTVKNTLVTYYKCTHKMGRQVSAINVRNAVVAAVVRPSRLHAAAGCSKPQQLCRRIAV